MSYGNKHSPRCVDEFDAVNFMEGIECVGWDAWDGAPERWAEDGWWGEALDAWIKEMKTRAMPHEYAYKDLQKIIEEQKSVDEWGLRNT